MLTNMKLFIKAILIGLLFLGVSSMSAQKGIVRGTITEDATGEPMFAVTVAIAETGTGAVTDFDGKFELELDPGIYNLECSSLGFSTLQITEVEVKAGEVTVFDNVRLTAESELIDEIVITADVVRNTEAALLTIQRKSPNLLNGISAQTFKKIGDGDAAAAVKRVTGVSIEGGKYVFVRGLGDRYSKTMLNGTEIPGLDPDRNSIQIDIFPTNLIQNLVVLKSSVAEMPADFTGGVVNIETKDLPEERIFDISFSLGFNPDQHFNDEYVSYEGGATDWLGFDDGTRRIPQAARRPAVISPINGDSPVRVNSFLGQFDQNLAAQQQRSFLDYSVGVTLADQIDLGESSNSLGYIFTGSYKNSTSFLNDIQYGEFQNAVSPTDFELVSASRQNGILGSNNVLLAGMAGLAYKTKNSKYKLTLMHLQNGESKTGQFSTETFDDAIGRSDFVGVSDNLDYQQRSLTNLLLHGKHVNNDTGWELDWKLAPTISLLDDPDIRSTAFSVRGDEFIINAGEGGNPSRIWRNLEEINVNGRVDFAKDLKISQREAKLKFGGSYLFKERDYEILQFNIQFFGAQPVLTGDPNQLLEDDNLYPNGSVILNSGNGDPNPNEYNSTIDNAAAYASLEFEPAENLKAVVGLRAENYIQRHTGRDQSLRFVLEDEEVLNSLDLFPSTNFIYSLTENQNLRVSYSRTIARPSFKENSFAQILDPLTNRIFNGARFPFGEDPVTGEFDWDGNIRETRINNFDVRWELFGTRAQNLSLSAFYKTFADPIELVRIPQAQASNEFQPRNVGDGQVFGVELEFGKALDFIGESFSKFSVNGNVTLVHSQIEVTDLEFNSRVGFEKEGETIERIRQMAGQAPYIINAGLSYNEPEAGLTAGLFYNVKGPTLTVVGGSLFPDVFSEPFHSLNFSINKSFGRFSISVQAENILNDQRQEFFRGFNAADQIFTQFSPDRSFGLGLSYSIY